MGEVVSLGSINVDKIRQVSESDVAAFRDRYEWFPERGETIKVEDVPGDFWPGADTVRHGGKGGNQAVAAARADARTTMLGKVGPAHDEFDVLTALSEAGVAVEHVDTTDVPTGTAYVFVGEDGESWIVVRPGANDTVDWPYVEAHYNVILDADCLLLQNEIPVDPVETLLTRLADEPSRPTVVLDPAPAEGAARLLAHRAVDYITPNETEYATLEPSLDEFDGVVVRTRGSDDVIVENDRQFTVRPPCVEAVDTTGAGDVLNGFLAARLAAGASLRDAVETGAIAGSLSTLEAGARSGIPTLEDIRTIRGTNQQDV